MNGDLTDVPGVAVGNAGDDEALTGVTVILPPGEGAVAGVDVRGGAPGTRETDLMRPARLVPCVNAVMLAGGSAFGLDATAGVMRFLEERGSGFDVGVAKVPIVPAAVIFDLNVGASDRRPDPAMAYQACERASCNRVPQGNVGAGLGATVGKFLGISCCMKGGLGSASVRTDSGVTVGALVVVNAFGDVRDSLSGEIVAGAINPMTGKYLDTLDIMRRGREAGDFADVGKAGRNTTIAVVATDALLDVEAANLVARMAHDGIARAVVPAHTLYDGDVVFALSCGRRRADPSCVGALAADVLARACVSAVKAAVGAAGLKAYADVSGGPPS